MKVVHKYNYKLGLALCEGLHWIFGQTPQMSNYWKNVTCKRCLAARKKK